MEVKLQIVAPRTRREAQIRDLAVVESSKRGLSETSARPSAPLFSPAEMRHEFAIWTLERDGVRGHRLHLYYCIRCNQAFRVDDRSGSVAALDQDGSQLLGPEAFARLASFEAGPCPAFGHLIEDREKGLFRNPRRGCE